MEDLTVQTENKINEAKAFLLELSKKLPYDMEELKKELTKEEIDLVGNLFTDSLVYLRWNDDIPHLDFQELVLTCSGKVEIFKIKYVEEIEIFKNYLKNNRYRYDDEFITKFLFTSDLSKSPDDILTLDNMIYYSSRFDIYIGR